MEVTGYVEVNGVKYRERNPERHINLPSRLHSIIMIANAFAAFDPFAPKTKERPKVDLVKEFELIQNKKSKLSRRNRDWVEHQFHQNFIKVDGQ